MIKPRKKTKIYERVQISFNAHIRSKMAKEDEDKNENFTL